MLRYRITLLLAVTTSLQSAYFLCYNVEKYYLYIKSPFTSSFLPVDGALVSLLKDDIRCFAV